MAIKADNLQIFSIRHLKTARQRRKGPETRILTDMRLEFNKSVKFIGGKNIRAGLLIIIAWKKNT